MEILMESIRMERESKDIELATYEPHFPKRQRHEKRSSLHCVSV